MCRHPSTIRPESGITATSSRLCDERDQSRARFESHNPGLATTGPHDPADRAPPLRGAGRAGILQSILEGVAAVAANADAHIGLRHRRRNQLLAKFLFGHVATTLTIVGVGTTRDLARRAHCATV
jgi:hypothetical protein